MRVAIVTGAASGIGRACALLFLERGCAVVATDRDAEGLADTVRLAGAGTPLEAITADVCRGDEVRNLVARTIERFGGLHILVTAAGIGGTPNPVDRLPEEEWDAVVGASLRGTYLCCKEAIPKLRRSGGGAIVTFGSVLGHEALAGTAAYGAAKAGIEALTRAMAIDHAREGIRANCILPGSTDTPLMWAGVPEEQLARVRAIAAEDVPLGRVADPVEIALVVWFLASEEASFVTGASLPADGGILAKASTSY